MNKDQIRGKWEELKGKVKRSYGDATGNRKTQAEGAIQEGGGKFQEGVGKVRDDLDKAFDRSQERKEPEP